MVVELKNVEFKMWEKLEMDESSYNKETKSFVKTGKKEEKTTYILRDLVGDKLVLLGNNDYRNLEGKRVDVQLDLVHDEFKKINRIKFVSMSESKTK